jgi:hypothetical protein
MCFFLTTADAGSVFGERKGSRFGKLPGSDSDFHGINDVSKTIQKSILEAHDDDGFYTNAALARSSPNKNFKRMPVHGEGPSRGVLQCLFQGDEIVSLK